MYSPIGQPYKGIKKEMTWNAFVDGYNNFKGFGIYVVIMDNGQTIHKYLVCISFLKTNNFTEYEATIFGVIIARNLGA